MKAATVATVTFREILRRKVQVSLLVFGSLMILASFMISQLTIGESHRILSDLGLSAMSAFGTLIAVFVGATLVAGDVERRALYPVLAKPVSRTQYLLGRYAGLALSLVANLAIMAAVLASVLCLDARSLSPLDVSLAGAVAMLGVQFLVVGAVAILFSSVTSATLASILTLSVAVAGHLTNEMRALWQDPATAWLPKVIWYVLPNLGSLSLNANVVYRVPIGASAWMGAGYAALYAAAALVLAAIAFERRDLR